MRFNRHDLHAIMAFITDDAVFESLAAPIPGASATRAQAAVRECLAKRFAGIPDVPAAPRNRR